MTNHIHAYKVYFNQSKVLNFKFILPRLYNVLCQKKKKGEGGFSDYRHSEILGSP